MEENLICCECVREPYLRNLIKHEAIEAECSYCNDRAPAIPLDEMANYIETAFEEHYSRTSAEPSGYEYAMLKDKELEYDWERDGEPTVYAIMNASDIPEKAASDIQKILGERHYDFDEAAMGDEGEFSSETHYEQVMPGDEYWQQGWRHFEQTIKSHARFFSQSGAAQLKELFGSIDKLRTAEDRSLIVEAGPNTDCLHLYRARVFQSDKALKTALTRPDKELSAPPSHIACAGRMNAQGISVFYGATSTDTALAEVRPPVGSQVAVARFQITRPIKLLDLTALRDVHESGSIFDPSYAYRLGRMMFLRKLSSRISRPVMPDDEASEYLPTQAISDFLATENKVSLDGVLYPSVQVGGAGLNVVLFHKSSRCEELIFPSGTELTAQTYSTYEDGPEPDYSVTEAVPAKEDSPEDETSPFPDHMPPDHAIDEDAREETLSVDLEAVNVHLVTATQIDTQEFPVGRHRWIKQAIPF